MQETWVQSLGWEDLLEKEIETSSSILPWEIPWTEEPGELQSLGYSPWGKESAMTSQMSTHACKPLFNILSVFYKDGCFKDQSCSTPSNPLDCSLPGSSVHGIFKARVLVWVAIAFSLNLSSYCFYPLHEIGLCFSLLNPQGSHCCLLLVWPDVSPDRHRKLLRQ